MTADRHRAQGSESAAAPGPELLRRLLLALVMLGSLGLGAELILLEHTESVYQWLPLIVLAAAFVLAAAVLLRPRVRTVRLFQALNFGSLVIGALGFYLHYQGNSEFELEMDPAARGLALIWGALSGATPALAPGALAQIGLIGLIATYRHPLLRHSARDLSPHAPQG